jgi:hypothetical protein
MTNTQSSWIRRLEISVLVAGLVFTAVVAAASGVQAWLWSDKSLLWSVFAAALSATFAFANELLGRASIWSEAVVEQVRGLCLVLMAVSALSPIAITYPDQWGGLVIIIAGALGVWVIIRARRRMRGDSGGGA